MSRYIGNMHSKANVELNCKCHNIARIYTMRLLSLNLSNNQILCYKKSCIRFVVENVSRVALHRIAFWVRECGNKSKQFNTIAFSVIFHNLSIPLLQLHSFVRSFARSVGWMVLREKIGFVAIDAYVTEVVFFCICVCVCACVWRIFKSFGNWKEECMRLICQFVKTFVSYATSTNTNTNRIYEWNNPTELNFARILENQSIYVICMISFSRLILNNLSSVAIFII